jgi:hypothetical protein
MWAVAVVPVILLVLFTGLLWLGLLCDRERRRYITVVSQQAMGAIGTLLHGAAGVPPPPARAPHRIRA